MFHLILNLSSRDTSSSLPYRWHRSSRRQLASQVAKLVTWFTAAASYKYSENKYIHLAPLVISYISAPNRGISSQITKARKEEFPWVDLLLMEILTDANTLTGQVACPKIRHFLSVISRLITPKQEHCYSNEWQLTLAVPVWKQS